MAFVVVYDACVLYPNALRDLLIRVALEGTVRAHWSKQILDEVFRSLQRNREDLDRERLDRTRLLMGQALPDAMVSGYEPLIEGLSLPDPDDRHVLAVAIKAAAQVIVTENLKDFPDSALAPFGIEAKAPDDFLLDQFHISESVVRSAVRDMARARTQSVSTTELILDELERVGVVQLSAVLRE
ncbi:MAG: hypothetical protein JWR83_1689 [Aeromicrobium sp.]|nr:hypothetical protein [Aeromicrobium sp.]